MKNADNEIKIEVNPFADLDDGKWAHFQFFFSEQIKAFVMVVENKDGPLPHTYTIRHTTHNQLWVFSNDELHSRDLIKYGCVLWFLSRFIKSRLTFKVTFISIEFTATVWIVVLQNWMNKSIKISF